MQIRINQLNHQLNNMVNNQVNNQEGSILVLVLLVVVTLTFAGMAAMNDTANEIDLTRNHTRSEINLYTAEAAARQGGQIVMNETNTDLLDPDSGSAWPFLLDDPDETLIPTRFVWDPLANPAALNYTGPGGAGNTPMDQLTAGRFQAAYVIAYNGISEGSEEDDSGLSADTGETTRYQYMVYSRSATLDGSQKILKVAILRRW